VCVDSSLFDLSSLNTLLVAFDDIWSLSIVLGDSRQCLSSLGGLLQCLSSVDETGSRTFVGDHLSFPRFLLSRCGRCSHLFISKLSLGSIGELRDSFFYLLAFESLASWICRVDGTYLRLRL